MSSECNLILSKSTTKLYVEEKVLFIYINIYF